MIFKELHLQNFRQFYGEQAIVFATDTKQKKVTVLHGFNGAGKTTLLNAFTWLLYREFSPDFEDSDRLETEVAFKNLSPGERLVVSVRLDFEDRNRNYQAIRSEEIIKDESGKRIVGSMKLSLVCISETGEFEEIQNPQDSLERMLPKPLYPFFFFNGERIERLANEDAYEEVEEGVKILLDIELFDRAIKHLDEGQHSISKRLRDEIASHSGQEGELARQELEALEQELSQRSSELEQARRNEASLKDRRNQIYAKFRTLTEVAPLHKEREEKEKQFNDTKIQLADKRTELCKVLSQHGYLILMPQVIEKAEAVLAKAYKQGDIPVKIKRQFVEDLLHLGRCICKRELLEGEPPYQEVLQWRNLSKLSDLEEVVNLTMSSVERLKERREKAIQEMNRLQQKREELQLNLKKLDEALSEISHKIKHFGHSEDPAKLESQLEKTDKQIEDHRIYIRQREKAVQRLEQQIQEKNQEIRHLDKADAQGQMAQRRLGSVQKVIELFKQIRRIRYEELRKDLSTRLKEIWDRIAIKDYQALVDEGFHLRLTKMIGGEMELVRGASTGEKQVLSLAFVGSLLDKAKSSYEQARQNPNAMFHGGLYPLVMDSPFGSLEDEYRRGVARWLPTLAPQLIIMVSETQWRTEVEQELQQYMGREWVLCCETPKSRSRNVEFRGQTYEYVIQSVDQTEKTTVREVHV